MAEKQDFTNNYDKIRDSFKHKKYLGFCLLKRYKLKPLVFSLIRPLQNRRQSLINQKRNHNA